MDSVNSENRLDVFSDSEYKNPCPNLSDDDSDAFEDANSEIIEQGSEGNDPDLKSDDAEMVMVSGGENVLDDDLEDYREEDEVDFSQLFNLLRSTDVTSEEAVEGSSGGLCWDGSSPFEHFGIMINSTLASKTDGAAVDQLEAYFRNDWNIDPDAAAESCGVRKLEQLLELDVMKKYVELQKITGDKKVFSATSLVENEHILKRIADAKLSEKDRQEKRRQQRVLELMKPENQAAFIEGKTRILKILLRRKAYDEPVTFQTIHEEYKSEYGVALNQEEQKRLFRNKSAKKNMERAFFKEVEIVSDNPLMVKLKSSNVEFPETFTEEDLALIANMTEAELPVFTNLPSIEVHRPVAQKSRLPGRQEPFDTVEKRKMGEALAATMNWDLPSDVSDSEEDEIRVQPTNDKKTGGAFGGVIPLQRESKIDERDKYTDDGDSSGDSGSSKIMVEKKHRKKQEILSGHIDPGDAVGQSSFANDGHSIPERLSRYSQSMINVADERHRSETTSRSKSRRRGVAERSLRNSLKTFEGVNMNSSSPFAAADTRFTAENALQRAYTCDKEHVWADEVYSARPCNSSGSSHTQTHQGHIAAAHMQNTGSCPPNHSEGYGNSRYIDHCDPEVYEEDYRNLQSSSEVWPPANGNRHQYGVATGPLSHSPRGRFTAPPIRSMPDVCRDRSCPNYTRSSESGFANCYTYNSEQTRSHSVRESEQSSRCSSRQYVPDHFRRGGDDFPAFAVQGDSEPAYAATQTPQFSRFVAPSSGYISKCDVSTQSDDDWVETVLQEWGVAISGGRNRMFEPSAVGGSQLDELIFDIVRVVYRRRRRIISLHDLQKAIEHILGYAINPENEREIRMSWEGLIERSGRLQIHELPTCDGVEKFVTWKKE